MPEQETGQGRTTSSSDKYRRKAKPGPNEDWRDWDFDELVALTCAYLAGGVPPQLLPKRMLADHQVRIHRERPYHFLAFAAMDGRIAYTPPPQAILTLNLKDSYSWLTSTRVIHTGTAEDVALAGARQLLAIVQEVRQYKESHGGADVIHIGINGGHTLQRVCVQFARLLGQTEGDQLPEKIVFHTMVAGVSDDPMGDPIAFCTYFADNPAIVSEMEFSVLHAPAIVYTEGYDQSLLQPGIADTYQRRKQLDIIVTSLSDWSDGHSLLAGYMRQHDEASYEAVVQSHAFVGDMLTRPLGPGGPIPDDLFTTRALTLMDLEGLPDFLSNAKNRVLLVSGPCPVCNAPKTNVLRAVLGYPKVHGLAHRLISDLVVDSRTARQLLGQ